MNAAQTCRLHAAFEVRVQECGDVVESRVDVDCPTRSVPGIAAGLDFADEESFPIACFFH
jgi:hypothetical protein